MNEDQEEGNTKREDEDEEEEDDDLEEYLKEMKALESDFSDLEDLDLEELQEIQDAIAKVKEDEVLYSGEFADKGILESEINGKIKEEKNMKEALISDFSDIGEIDLDELREMQNAIEIVKQEEKIPSEEEGAIQSTQEVSIELEEKIKQELLKRKELKEEEVITPEKFLNYIQNKRDKIWYHALFYLVFNVEDQVASKSLLFDVLKEVTSKSPIDPIPEHQFYFGLGYILRLTLNNRKIVRFLRDRKFKINVNIDILKEILEEAGDPISTRPIIKEEEKKKMYNDFLKDDFLDI